MTMINAFDPSAGANLSAADRTLIERRERVLGPAYRLFYAHPAHFVRGEGVWLYDDQGNPYLDVYNNVASVGHCRPEVVEAIARQASVLNTHTRYLHDGIVDFAEDFLKEFPSGLRHLMLTCTGSEANDLALRIARHYTGGTGVIVTKLAYHGVTGDLAELSPSLGSGNKIAPHVRLVDAPDQYRGTGDVAASFAASVAQAIADMKQHNIKPAALLVDTIFSSDGVFADPAGFLKPAVDEIRRAGGIFIADEVQPGFGRTGVEMWGFQRHDILPDIVTVGKPMGNGHPVAGIIVSPTVVDSFGKTSRYFNTFGGNPVSCAAAHAVLKVIKGQKLQENALTTGQYLADGLKRLATKYPLIGDVRGSGLFIGVELISDSRTKQPATAETTRLVNGLRERRVLISATGPHANVLKIRPPLVFSQENAAMFLSILDETLATI